MPTWIRATSRIALTISLAILFGGSMAVVIAAICLVKAATHIGMDLTEAASLNAPGFIVFGKIALVAALILLLSEAIDYATRAQNNRLVKARYVTSLLCVIATTIFALGLIPPMERLRPIMASNIQAKREFHKLHEASRTVFGITILSALFSLVLLSANPDPTVNEKRKIIL